MWAAQHAVVEGENVRRPEYETDRARFLGRGRGLREPVAVLDGRRLSNTVGTVLDPIFALRYRIRVPAGGTVRIAVWTFVAASRDSVLQLLDKHRDSNAFVRAGTLAWTQGQVQLRHLGIDAAEASLFQRLAGHVLYANAAMRPAAATISRGAAGPAALWAHGISGDLPIVLVRIDDVDDIDIVRQLLRAQEYWQLKELAVDLVFLNERASSYVQDLQNALETQLRMSQSRPRLGGDRSKGAVFLLRTDLIPRRRVRCCSRWRGWCCPGSGAAWRAARPTPRAGGRGAPGRASPRRGRRCRKSRPPPAWNISTAWVASPPTDAST